MLIPAGMQKALKVCHLVGVSSWGGGCLAIMVLLYASAGASAAQELFGVLKGLHFVNVTVLLFGGFTTFFTSLAYSLCTPYGFVRTRWVALKWLLLLLMGVLGILFLGPRGTELLETADYMGIIALETPGFMQLSSFLFLLLAVQFSLLVLAIILSVYKPWEGKDAARRAQQA